MSRDDEVLNDNNTAGVKKKVEGCRIVEAVNTREVGQTELRGAKNDRTIPLGKVHGGQDQEEKILAEGNNADSKGWTSPGRERMDSADKSSKVGAAALHIRDVNQKELKVVYAWKTQRMKKKGILKNASFPPQRISVKDAHRIIFTRCRTGRHGCAVCGVLHPLKQLNPLDKGHGGVVVHRATFNTLLRLCNRLFGAAAGNHPAASTFNSAVLRSYSQIPAGFVHRPGVCPGESLGYKEGHQKEPETSLHGAGWRYWQWEAGPERQNVGMIVVAIIPPKSGGLIRLAAVTSRLQKLRVERSNYGNYAN
ncbi:hypothetical protein B0H19DRAFT_1334733 [Mycena capillaripes]|nr:hypothetical protein B0H19DRAFT_1334733 [Mycena capillaripes]